MGLRCEKGEDLEEVLWVTHVAKETGSNAQGVGGAALKLPEEVCPMEAAKPLPGTQGCGPGAPQFRSQLGPRGRHWLAQGGHVLLLTGNQLRHQTLLGAAGTTRSVRGSWDMGPPTIPYSFPTRQLGPPLGQ